MTNRLTNLSWNFKRYISNDRDRYQDFRRQGVVIYPAYENLRSQTISQVAVRFEKARRTNRQNNLYWAYIAWCIHPKGGNLRAQGRLSADALH